MAVRLKISKVGYPVTTGNANLTFSDLLATHAIYDVVDVTQASGNSSVTYNHALGYIPKTWVFFVGNDGEEYYRRIPLDDFFNLYDTSLDYYVTANDIIIEVDSNTPARDFRIVIFTRATQP